MAKPNVIMHDITPETFTAPCDFCGAGCTSIQQYDQWQVSHWQVPIDGSGSDHLAVWCRDCGPKHREGRTAFQGVN